MNTTLLFVEIVIAGLQSLLWVALLTLSLTGVEWLKNVSIQDLGEWSFLVSALFFSLAYSLGILVDRSAKFIFSFWDNRLQKRYLIGKTQSMAALRFRLENESLNKHLEYIRTRMRIARSSALNFFLITVFGVVLINRITGLTSEQKGLFSWTVLGVGILLVLLFMFTWYSISNTHYNLVTLANKKS